MASWSWSDVKPGKPAGGGVKVTVTLDPDRARLLDGIAGDADCSRAEIARRLLTAVIDDDAAAHGEVQ